MKKIELKGTLGSQGSNAVVKGIVKVVETEDDIKAFSEGQIAVIRYFITKDGFGELLEKAVAIVTNEGVNVSPIAVVARAYHLPCVLNTKTATVVLQDGDEIEINIDRTSVKLVNR